MTTITPPLDPAQDEVLHGKEASRAVRKALSSPIASAAVILLSVLWTIPTLGLFINSFRSKEDAATTGWWEFFVHPSFSLDTYKQVLTADGGLTLPLVNSLAITIPATIIPIFIASMAAYALAWMRFRGSDAIFFTIFALQVVPLQMALVPLQQYYVKGLQVFGVTIIPSPHVNGTLAQIWISHTMFSLPLAVFLLHNFVAQIPESLIEAARVDGAPHLRIFRSIVLPLSMPAIASFAIFQFLWVWNDLLVAKTFGSSDPAQQPVTARLQSLTGSFGAHQELLAPAGFIAIVIPLIVFLALQRYFARGLLAGSVKG
ncbi:carbohydrate ABC transporter permease [Luteimicrobium xylanilyticum]|uniref:Alpha-glucoside transport system permease protein AglG n=1 Tax=Luteimicrobium xylanilyticum TaxID=1133546 RepID=A0A5P9Q650_9MICO|nr:carbohydrate ABC transporter permease [Luteimicrobium xylanilyticum]QFU96746.1 Alpha-glucoside transport system permease protein AglG [Luteimicrobium xylanilyticum]